jgi:prepilin-type N-terminal cleavage/methylation domain-containing protein
MRLNQKSGFTLLEIIIVIIIVGVLASLALPRFFSTVEFSRSTEALASMSSIRGSIERCYLAQGGIYTGCTMGVIDVANPGTSPGANFTYLISPVAAAYTIFAQRNTLSGGDGTSRIIITQTATGVTRSGTGTFVGIK